MFDSICRVEYAAYRSVIYLPGLLCRNMERVMVECYGLLSIFLHGYRRKNERYMAMRLPLLDSQIAIKVDTVLDNDSDQRLKPISVSTIRHLYNHLTTRHKYQNKTICLNPNRPLHSHLSSTNHTIICSLAKCNTAGLTRSQAIQPF